MSRIVAPHRVFDCRETGHLEGHKIPRRRLLVVLISFLEHRWLLRVRDNDQELPVGAATPMKSPKFAVMSSFVPDIDRTPPTEAHIREYDWILYTDTDFLIKDLIRP